MTFRVRQKVVCVDDRSTGRYIPSGMVCTGSEMHGLVAGAVYTIRDVGVLFGVVVCRLEEIYRPIEPLTEEESVFAQARFRPVVERNAETDISFAHEILRDVSRKETVRA